MKNIDKETLENIDSDKDISIKIFLKICINIEIWYKKIKKSFFLDEISILIVNISAFFKISVFL